MSDFTLGHLVQVSHDDPFAGSMADDIEHQVGILTPNSEVEPQLAVDPTDPNHLVGVFQQDRWSNVGCRGLMAGVSFDGGQGWQEVVIPGLSLVSGGAFQRASDPGVSFAPNGDLYFSALVLDKGPSGLIVRNAILASKSPDGGLTWTAPVTIDLQFPAGRGPRGDDFPMTKADPTDPQFAYITWRVEVQPAGSDQPTTREMFSRTTDGGRTWEPPRILYDPGSGPRTTGTPLIVQPDGTLIDFLTVTSPGGDPEFLLLRSPDRGQTWTPQAIRIATQQPVEVTDPANGQLVTSASPLDDVAGDPSNGNLYAVWEDGRFNGRQHAAVAFSMSTDGGLTWSEPIQINQTPTDIDSGNQQAFIPMIQVAADGTVGVTYYDFRFNDPLPGLATDYWFVHANPSDPGGLTNAANWAHELRLTNSSFDLERAPHLVRGLFVGDYEGLAVAGNSFRAFWAQPHGTDPGNIFFRRIDQPGLATVASVVINDGSAQRSMVNSLTVTFSTVVHLDPGAFELVRQDGGAIQFNVSQAIVDGHSVDTLTFSGAEIHGGSLADGHYTLTIHGNLVHDDFAQALDGDRTDTFFRLFGDSNGDGHVGLEDLLGLASTFGKRAGDPGYLWYFDYDGDGRVDIGDLVQFLRRFGR